MEPDAMILVFWMLSLKSTFSLSSFTFIKRLFSSSSLSAIRVVSSAYLRLLIFLPAILIPSCASSRPVFLMMYSAYKLNRQGDNIQPWRTPFTICNQSVVPCPVIIVASWPVYRFLKRQVMWSGIPITLRIFQSVVIHTVKSFGIVNKAEIDVFLELTFSMIQQMLAIWSLVPLRFLKPAWTSGSSQFTYCWSLAWRILSINLLLCAAAAKSLQSCPTLCDPIDGSPPGSPVLGILQARTRVGCHFLLQCMKGKVKVKSLSRVRLLATPWTTGYQAPSMGFSRQEYWSGLSVPSPCEMSAVVW